MSTGPVERAGRWVVEHIHDTPAAAHARDLPRDGLARAWVMDARSAAVVLGSTQRLDLVDTGAADRLGVDVVRRRSGGGAVLVVPGDLVWVDVIVARDDPRWDPDVGRAMHWLGETWAAALAVLGLPTRVHTGPLLADDLARAVCFAGTGAGEVVSADSGAKVVGISQRRTRDHARFQTACLLRWDPSPLEQLLPQLTTSDLARLARAGAGVGLPAAAVLEAFLAALAQT